MTGAGSDEADPVRDGSGPPAAEDGGDGEDEGELEDEGGVPEPRVVDRADYDPDYDPEAPVICEVCGGLMEYTASCKLMCRNCGYMRDCSDP